MKKKYLIVSLLAAAKGLLFTVVWAPVVMIVRKLVSRCYSDVDY